MAAAESLNSDCPLYSKQRLLLLTLVCSARPPVRTWSEATSSRSLFLLPVQNLVELRQLPGLEEDKAFQKEIGLRTLVYKAYR